MKTKNIDNFRKKVIIYRKLSCKVWDLRNKTNKLELEKLKIKNNVDRLDFEILDIKKDINLIYLEMGKYEKEYIQDYFLSKEQKSELEEETKRINSERSQKINEIMEDYQIGK